MDILYIIIFLGIIFLAIYLFRRPKVNVNKPLFISGLLLSLTGAFLMWNGSILGENTTGIATVIGIVGIGLISTSSVSGKSKKIQINKLLTEGFFKQVLILFGWGSFISDFCLSF